MRCDAIHRINHTAFTFSCVRMYMCRPCNHREQERGNRDRRRKGTKQFSLKIIVCFVLHLALTTFSNVILPPTKQFKNHFHTWCCWLFYSLLLALAYVIGFFIFFFRNKRDRKNAVFFTFLHWYIQTMVLEYTPKTWQPKLFVYWKDKSICKTKR